MLKPSQSVTVDFTTHNASTGALADADELPTGTLSKNGTDTEVVVTVTNKSTGRYKAAFTVPGDYVAGDRVDLHIAATVATVAGGGVVFREFIEDTADGLTFARALKAILAVLLGKASPDGSTVAFKARDGSTTDVTITYGTTRGERTGSTLA
jgi:hypothetical protein